MRIFLLVLVLIVAASVFLSRSADGDISQTQHEEVMKVESQFNANKVKLGETAAWFLRKKV